MKASAFLAASLDGFIARENGDLDWLPGGGDDGEDYGYDAFMQTVDALVMGRNSYEKALTFGQWPYKKPVLVLSTRNRSIPQHLSGAVEAMAGSPAEVVARLSKRGARHLYIDGGKTIQGFLNAGLLQRLILTRIPVLIGRGIPLFGPLSQDIRLRHVETWSFANGLVQSTYEIISS